MSESRDVKTFSIIKRTGQEQLFNGEKIKNAITKANNAIDPLYKISDNEIEAITDSVIDEIRECSRQFNVEEIQDLVEKNISKYSWELAKAFTIYRYEHALQRDGDTAALNAKYAEDYKKLMDRTWNIYECQSEDIHQENANKNAYLLSTQADYSACEVDKELIKYKGIFSDDVLKAHAEGIIKIHDMGYSARRMFNCCLINLDDMFKNGTVINGVFIETPKSFDVACTVATQIESHIASGQYGGQTVNLWHIAQFVRITREKLIRRTRERYEKIGKTYTEEQVLEDAELQLKQHIEDGIQLLQYQILTHMTTNGQSPFVSTYININDAPEEDRKDYAMVIEAFLNQRLLGVKNKVGVYFGPAFPKVLYVLDENNVYEGTEYYYLTELAEKCSVLRLAPDYISAKVMRELKEGNVFACMGAVSPSTEVMYKINGEVYDGSIGGMYEYIKDTFKVKEEDQFGQTGNPNKDLNLKDLNIEIFDNSVQKFVKCTMMNKNVGSSFKMYLLTIFRNGEEYHSIYTTNDHPMIVADISEEGKFYDPEKAYECKVEDMLGKELCIYDSLETGNEKYEYKPIARRVIIKECMETPEFVYDVTTETGHFMANFFLSHNCRSFLSPWKDENGEYKFWGRFNKGVVTINLPDVALTSKETGQDFWELLDERLELCHKAHKQRIEKRLFGTKSDVSPVHWQYGAIARLQPGETIDKYLTGGYSTTSLGYVGLYETVMALKGVPHTDPSAKDFALSIVKHMADKCNEWNEQDDYGYSVYGTPEESTTFDFAKALQRRHGIIENITDKDYVINSYHVNVKEHIDAITKLKFEAPFQQYTTGGAVSYFECSRNIIHNMKAFHKVIEEGYNSIMYFEANTKPDYCYECGNFDHIEMVRDPITNKRIWKCSYCGNTNLHRMDVSRRICGYPGTVNFMNQGRMGDIGDRVEHI